MRRRTTTMLATAALALAPAAASIALLAGCGSSSATGEAPTTAIRREAAANIRPNCFPDCESEIIDGNPLEGADLRGGNFRGARWQGARLRGANLAGADLTGADLSPRHGYVGYWHGPGNPYSDEETPVPAAGDLPPTPSDLSGANLKGARLTDANLDGVIWSNTTCPNGTMTDTGC